MNRILIHSMMRSKNRSIKNLLLIIDMLLQGVLGILFILVFIIAFIATKVDRRTLLSKDYFEITIFLGVGGHTGQICELFKGFNYAKISRINILTASNDKSSINFWMKSLEKQLSKAQLEVLEKITNYYSLSRTNQVKQSYLLAFFTTIKAFLHSSYLIVMKLLSTTHLISTGPGTCVPLFYIFYVLKKMRFSRVKLIFIESWCRVEDLSLSGKLIRFIADQFVVHWLQLTAKYKNLKYFGQII